jgi:hypothetical protein
MALVNEGPMGLEGAPNFFGALLFYELAYRLTAQSTIGLHETFENCLLRHNYLHSHACKCQSNNS